MPFYCCVVETPSIIYYTWETHSITTVNQPMNINNRPWAFIYYWVKLKNYSRPFKIFNFMVLALIQIKHVHTAMFENYLPTPSFEQFNFVILKFLNLPIGTNSWHGQCREEGDHVGNGHEQKTLYDASLTNDPGQTEEQHHSPDVEQTWH